MRCWVTRTAATRPRSWVWQSLVSVSPCLFVALALLSAGCDLSLPGKPNPAGRPAEPDKVLDFEMLYQTHCAGCHGADGELGPAPPLNDALFLALIPDEDLLMTISEGRAVSQGQNTPMPAFARSNGGPLTAKQVQALAAGIKKKWGGPEPAPKSAPPYSGAEEAAAGTVRAGKRVFARACAGCHGRWGEGGKVAGAINNPAFLALISDQALRRLIITGRPDLEMPRYDGTAGRSDSFRPLTSTDVSNLVALLASWRETESDNGQ